MAAELQHQHIHTNNIDLHVVTLGSGPAVMLCHGFPGLWYSWRKQMQTLADAGFTAIAMDMRGYGRSDRPENVHDYRSDIIIADMLGILSSLGFEDAFWVGHDFGAPLVHNIAIRHPEKCRAVIAVGCPYDFDFYGRGCAGSAPAKDIQYPRGFALPYQSPIACSAAIAEHQFIHLHYFQKKGLADQELGENTQTFLQRIYWALSAKGSLLDWSKYPSEGTGYLDVLEPPKQGLPWPWMSQEDFDYMTQEYSCQGSILAFIGGLNSYRVADLNWEYGLPWADENITQPYLFISGELDPVLQMIGPDALELVATRCDKGLRTQLIPDAGHFVQMEQPELFNQALISFLQKHL